MQSAQPVHFDSSMVIICRFIVFPVGYQVSKIVVENFPLLVILSGAKNPEKSRKTL